VSPASDRRVARLAKKRGPISIDELYRVRDEVRAVDDRVVHLVALTDIHPSPHNPRHAFGNIAELAASLAEHGLLQPVVVRQVGPHSYELIAGHRRLEAARTLGWTEIAAQVRDETTEQAYILTLVENLQREDLTPREEAAALEVLLRERGWTTRQVGEAIKRSHAYVSRRLRVFEDEALAPLVLKDESPLPVSTAEELLGVADVDLRRSLAQQAADEGWERPQVRAAVRDAATTMVRSVPSARERGRQVVVTAVQLYQLLDGGPISELPSSAHAELQRLYQRLALLMAE
jgi:ParB family chromosome partitioning protein